MKITKDMLDLAKHIVDQKSGHFDPDKFEDNYETALIDLINQKRAGRPIDKVKVKTEGNVINLMDALRQSLKGQRLRRARRPPRRSRAAPRRRTARPRSRLAGQREMLLPIEGKGQKTAAKADTKRETAKRPARATTRQKRAG